MIIYTIGHSIRPFDEFAGMLQSCRVALLADVRTVPRSRHNPQFNRETLPDALAAFGIDYVHLAGLGGLRRARPDSPNLGWRNASFRGYADYMQTPEFAAALDELVELAKERQACIMCAEAVPWRCHRSLIGDALSIRGIEVQDIMERGLAKPHKITPFAQVIDGGILYPAETTGSP